MYYHQLRAKSSQEPPRNEDASEAVPNEDGGVPNEDEAVPTASNEDEVVPNGDEAGPNGDEPKAEAN